MPGTKVGRVLVELADKLRPFSTSRAAAELAALELLMGASLEHVLEVAKTSKPHALTKISDVDLTELRHLLASQEYNRALVFCGRKMRTTLGRVLRTAQAIRALLGSAPACSLA